MTMIFNEMNENHYNKSPEYVHKHITICINYVLLEIVLLFEFVK